MAKLEAGRVIGSYRVVRCIGKGGMGTVYEVEHVELGVHYALKTFTFNLKDEHAEMLKTKFLEEGKVLARLKHPNIAHVFDLAFDEATQMPYFVMDLVTYEDGESYTAADIDHGDIDEEMVYGWFKEVASALDYIHEQGIVHRDIKPSNLLVDKGLHVILTDFGVSHLFGGQLQAAVSAAKTMVTKTGRGKVVVGTEKYMAPEVSEGQEATPAADTYSLAVMLIWWLTGFYYSDNPGALTLLSQKKYNWVPVLARMLTPISRRPSNCTELVEMLKPKEEKPKDEGKAKERKTGKSRSLVANIIAVVVGVVVCVAVGVGVVRVIEKQNAGLAALQQQMRDKEAADAKAKEAEAAAKEKRIQEEKAKAEELRKAAELKRQQDEAKRVQIAKRASIKADLPTTVPVKPELKKTREFVQEEPKGVTAARNYGPIPERVYTWLRGGDQDAPVQEKFQLANGAMIDLMPVKRASFSMSNHRSDKKGFHRVEFTRPFWMSKYCVTTDQWREFAENDCEDCHEVEKALEGRAFLCIRMSRERVDKFCAYLSDKYRTQLPKGYVFRLPTEAEWEYVQDQVEVRMLYNQPHVRWWWEFVSIGGWFVKQQFAQIRNGQNSEVLAQLHEDGYWTDHRYRVGGLAKPTPLGVVDMWGEERMVLDVFDRKYITWYPYSDFEVDPLHWSDGLYDEQKSTQVTRPWTDDRHAPPYHNQYLFHLVLGPDLIAEKAWNNHRENYDYTAKVPSQRPFDPKKIPAKISKPREVVLRRVGDRIGGANMVFCEIPKGTFAMSNPDGQDKQYHKVTLTYPFWMSKYLVTAAEWREYARDDYKTRDVVTAERLFPKNPISIRNRYHQWMAYCEFLNCRYGHLLPKGYVFRLPTEAEWEWVFMADKNGDIRRMDGNEYCNANGRHFQEFEAMVKKVGLPKNLQYDPLGAIGEAYVGGRTKPTGFGVYDMVVHNFSDVMMLDTYDVQGAVNKDNGKIDWGRAEIGKNVLYNDRETDPVHYDGRCASFVLERSMGQGRLLSDRIGTLAHAHIVIAPDLTKPYRDAELEPFPENDFGGKFLGDEVRLADLSSKHQPYHNTDGQFRRMVSRENVVVAFYDKNDDTRGFHTEHEDSPWILLDLGKKRSITGLVIDAHNGNRCTRNLCIWVSDDGKHERLVDKEESLRHRYRIDLQKKNVKGRYIRIGREPKIEKNWFFLDKVVIYGKEK